MHVPFGKGIFFNTFHAGAKGDGENGQACLHANVNHGALNNSFGHRYLASMIKAAQKAPASRTAAEKKAAEHMACDASGNLLSCTLENLGKVVPRISDVVSQGLKLKKLRLEYRIGPMNESGHDLGGYLTI